MLVGLIQIFVLGFLGGRAARWLQVPPLLGMIAVGMALGTLLAPEVLASAPQWRTLAVTVILMKAGLGLDWEKLKPQGSVALRLGFLPAMGEAVAIALLAMVFLGMEWRIGLLLGCIIGAESPAVIVPGMLRLKGLGWGVAKGIPDAILTGSALSDVLLLLSFSLLMGQITATEVGSPFWLPLQVTGQIGLGIASGAGGAWLLHQAVTRSRWTEHPGQDLILATGLTLALVLLAETMPLFSGYLAVMAVGFFLVQWDGPLARRLRHGFDALWVGAEILLFVLLGASIPLGVLADVGGVGTLLLLLGTLTGRSLGWYFATLGSSWTVRERLFLLCGNTAKATVQAALGAIPLAQGVPGGEKILAIAALSILITAPLGAWAIPTFAPRLLERGAVDPTKVSLSREVKILAAVDGGDRSRRILQKAAELARRADATVVVLHVVAGTGPLSLPGLEAIARELLADIRYRLLYRDGAIAEIILQTAEQEQCDEIMIGKRSLPQGEEVLGSVARAVLGSSPIPVVVVE